MRPVTDERRPFFHESRDHDLTEFPVRNIFPGNRIDNFQIEIVVPDMHALVILAVNADARTVDLCQSIDIIQLNPEFIRNALPHFFAPAFRSDDTFLQADFVADPLFRYLFRKEKCVTGCCREDSRLHVDHKLKLFRRIARPHGHDHRPQLLRAVLETDTGCPQSVSRSDLDPVFLRKPRKFIAAFEHLTPVIHVFRRIRNDDRFAGCPGRRMDAHDLLLGNRHESERIGIAQVFLV